MPFERESNILETLNRDIQLYMEGGKSVYEAYSLMVDMNPYRVLADASYDWEEDPLLGSNIDVSYRQLLSSTFICIIFIFKQLYF